MREKGKIRNNGQSRAIEYCQYSFQNRFKGPINPEEYFMYFVRLIITINITNEKATKF